MTYILFSVVIAWLLAQITKVFTSKSKKVFFKPGGMPSSHAAFVSALSTAVGIQEGISNASFFITLAFSLIIVHDALMIRKHHSLTEVSAGIVIGVFVAALLFFSFFSNCTFC